MCLWNSIIIADLRYVLNTWRASDATIEDITTKCNRFKMQNYITGIQFDYILHLLWVGSKLYQLNWTVMLISSSSKGKVETL